MNKINEGDLYKVIKIDDVNIEIKYGYYSENDKYAKYNEPIPIYPDFEKNPLFNKDGFLVVTAMQNKCKYYKGPTNSDVCHSCQHLMKVEELLGICICKNNKNGGF